MAPPRQSPIAWPAKFDRQRRELDDRYGRRWIAAEERLLWTALEAPRRSEAVEPWIGAITRLSEAVLREDLEKADNVVNLASKFNLLNSLDKAFLETLKGELLPQRLTAVASLQRTGIPEAVEVLGLVLRELWARVTGGNSKLSSQGTAQLQRLLDLTKKAIADWERVKDPNQIEWCGHFCGPIWSLRQSGGEGPPGPVDYDVAKQDLRDLVEKAQGILTSRQLPVDQPHRGGAEPASEGARPSALEVEDELRLMRQDLNELKDLTLRLKEEVSTSHQDKLQMKEELEKLMSENGTLKCQVTEMDDRLKKMEHESSAEKELHQKLQCENLRMKDELMELQNEKLKMNEESLRHQVAHVEDEMKELKKEILIAQESQQSLADLQVEANQLVHIDEDLRTLESELLNTKFELKEFRLKHDASGVKAGFEKLELQRELLNMKKHLHEVSMKYDRFTFNGNLKMKRGVGEVKLLSEGLGFSVDTSGPHCFMVDAILKTPLGSFLSGQQLSKGTEILAADGSTVLVVPAAQLKVGDEVVVDGVPTKLTSVHSIPGEVRVLKITFQPDLPVAVFHPQPCIHSLGHKPKKPHRGGKRHRMVNDGADSASIPDTQGYLTD
ncbi:unnamed protein product [Durusdinium trenchii]|uniref:Uncharacterized protein n=1 Tax=Durusdinium trenchii TaxID=1381693 RepID=A0ABP0M5Q9_9DINO